MGRKIRRSDQLGLHQCHGRLALAGRHDPDIETKQARAGGTGRLSLLIHSS